MSGGIPRSINLLCQAALVYGFADEAQTIDKAIIEQIARDKIGIGFEQNAEEASLAPDLEYETQDRDEIIARIRALEEKMRNLEGQIQSQLLRSAFGADNFKDQLIRDLVQLLTEERKRNDELLRRSRDIELKHGNPKQFEE